MSSRQRSITASGMALVLAAGAVAALLGLRALLVDPPLDRLAQRVQGDARVYQGSWHFPRGGPYILGFEASAPARLFIDDRQVAAGQGQTLARRVYEPGIRAVRFEVPAHARARLLWHPPGRRGPPEYVPPSSLSPDPPAQAGFGRWAGAAPVDGAIAAAIVLILLGLCLYLARGVLARVDRGLALGFAAVAVLGLGVRLVGLGAAGQTWDEDVNWSAGRNYITNWLSLDFHPDSWVWNYEHPPIMKYIAGIGAQFADGYDPARALSALLVALGCALLVPIGRRLYSLPVGMLAGVMAALMPHLVAHGKVVGHEAPTVLLWALGIWLALRAHEPPTPASTLDSGPDCGSPSGPTIGNDPLPGRLVVLGLVLGLAVFSRFVNLLLAPLVGAILLITAPPGRRARTLWLGLAILVPMIAIVGVISWPRLWNAPIAHLQQAWLKLRKPHGLEPFLGELTNRPPRYYFAAYLAATAPAGILLGAVAWLVRAVRRRVEARRSLVLGLWLLVPMLVALSPVRQDGVRYIMPCLLAMAVAAAAGIDYLLGHLRGLLAAALARTRPAATRPARAGTGAALRGTGAIVGIYLAVTCARIHPYYLDYYGEHVGGPATVAQRRWFEVAWWGEGIADAIHYVNRHAAPGARVFKACVEPGHLTWMRADLWASEARDPRQADWILAYHPSWSASKGRCAVPPGARLVHEVEAQGAPLVHVYRVGRMGE